MKRIIFPLLLWLFLAGSCKAPKDVVYFQHIENLTEEQKEAMNQVYNPKICIDDALIINVTSPDGETAAKYSLPPYSYYTPAGSSGGKNNYTETTNLHTYLVDESGCIHFPLLGRIQLAGLSIHEATRKMEELLKPTVPGVLVGVSISNFKVGIVGEVGSPNMYQIEGARVSILDLIAMAGDLRITGDRKNVWLYRDNNGKKEYIQMDLTDPALFASPYFYLQQNDVLYVAPNDAQKKNSRYNSEKTYRTSLFAMIISGLTAVSTIIVQTSK
jgi:polysaccharide export outer membrane protein